MNNHVSEETLSEHHPWHKRCWRSENWADILTEWPQDVVQNTTPNPPLTVPDTDTLFVDQQTLSSFCCTILFLKLPCVCQSVVSVWPWGPDVWRRRRLVLFYDTWPCISFDFVPPCCTGEVGVCVRGGSRPLKDRKKSSHIRRQVEKHTKETDYFWIIVICCMGVICDAVILHRCLPEQRKKSLLSELWPVMSWC